MSPLSPAALNSSWQPPTGSFWTPRLAGHHTPCLELRGCKHDRCGFLRRVAKSTCRLCTRPIGWGVHVKPDPQPQLFGELVHVHVECDAERAGGELRVAGRVGAALRRSRR